MTWQQTMSSGWKGQMWFASALPIPPSASLTQTFSHGLTLLHNQHQDHAQHIAFIGNGPEWANHSLHSMCPVSSVIMEKRYIYIFNFGDMKDCETAKKKKRGGMRTNQDKPKKFSLKVSVHPIYKNRFSTTWSLGGVCLSAIFHLRFYLPRAVLSLATKIFLAIYLKKDNITP